MINKEQGDLELLRDIGIDFPNVKPITPAEFKIATAKMKKQRLGTALFALFMSAAAVIVVILAAVRL